MEINECLRKISQGDVTALQHLYHSLRVPVFATAYAIVKNKTLAEDVLQETFIRVFDKVRTYTSDRNPRAWVLSIARNLAFDSVRQRKFIADRSLYEGDVEDFSDGVTDRVVLKATLTDLNEIERQIVVLHVIAGLSHAEIAEELDLNPSTVRWRYQKALKYLRNALGGTTDGHT